MILLCDEWEGNSLCERERIFLTFYFWCAIYRSSDGIRDIAMLGFRKEFSWYNRSFALWRAYLWILRRLFHREKNILVVAGKSFEMVKIEDAKLNFR